MSTPYYTKVSQVVEEIVNLADRPTQPIWVYVNGVFYSIKSVYEDRDGHIVLDVDNRCGA